MDDMWVAGVAKENYLNFQCIYEKTREVRRGKQIVVFGAGIMGMQFGYVMEALGEGEYCFCDNDSKKWGKRIANKEVICPQQLVGKSKQYFIFLAMERYEACALQLEELGYDQDREWTLISNCSEKTLLDSFQRDNEASVLIMGDCAANVVSITDKLKISLVEKLYVRNKVKVLALNGLYMRSYYALLMLNLELMKNLNKVVLLLDVGIFQEKFCLYPKNQHESVFEEIYEISKSHNEQIALFLKEMNKRAKEGGILSVISSPNRKDKMSENEIDQERKIHMRLNYLYPFKQNSESTQYLELFLQECSLRKIEVVCVIMPVNYEMGEAYFGRNFFEKYEKIRDELVLRIKNNEGTVLDLSYSLRKDDFICIRSTNEGMLETGRSKVAEAICKTYR